MAIQQNYGTGRRKTSTARVFMSPAAARSRSTDASLRSTSQRRAAHGRPPALNILELDGKFDFHVTVAGGGPSGQAAAIRMGISRALLKYNDQLRAPSAAPAPHARSAHEGGKKPGQKAARRRFQFSKR